MSMISQKIYKFSKLIQLIGASELPRAVG